MPLVLRASPALLGKINQSTVAAKLKEHELRAVESHDSFVRESERNSVWNNQGFAIPVSV